MEKRKILCTDCVYVRLYENLDLTLDTNFELLYEMAPGKLEGLKKDRGWLKVMYESSKRWKEENNHDCYLKKNMEVVKLIVNENIKLIK